MKNSNTLKMFNYLLPSILLFTSFGCGNSNKQLKENVYINTGVIRTKTNADQSSADAKNPEQDPLMRQLIAVTKSTIFAETSASSDNVTRHGTAITPSPTTLATALPTASPTPEARSKVSTEASESTKTEQIAQFNVSTPQALLLDATNLEAVLRPTFKNFGNLSATDSRYFSDAQKTKLGEYTLFGVQRMGSPITISQDYIFELRTFAGRACSNLVNFEIANSSNTSNVLVLGKDWTDKKITTNSVNGFMTKVFGFSNGANLFHAGVNEFVSLFNESISSAGVAPDNRTKDAAMIDNYKLLCVYIVSDPRTFSR